MRRLAPLRSSPLLWKWSCTMAAFTLFLVFSITLTFIRYVYLARDHTYWWEGLHVGWVGERITTFTARHVSVHIPGMMVDPVPGWKWLHYLLTLLMTGSCLGAVWFVGGVLIQRFANRGLIPRVEPVGASDCDKPLN